MFDAADDLLYVGQSINPGHRFKSHRQGKDWWLEVASMTLQQCASKEELDAAERTAIAIESPRYNITHNPDRMVDRSVPHRAADDPPTPETLLVLKVDDPADRAVAAHQVITETLRVQDQLSSILRDSVATLRSRPCSASAALERSSSREPQTRTAPAPSEEREPPDSSSQPISRSASHRHRSAIPNVTMFMNSSHMSATRLPESPVPVLRSVDV